MAEELKTLKELYPTESEFVAAAKNDYIGDATLTAIYKSFYWRKVCSNEMFLPYLFDVFQRRGQQYNDLLRFQLVRIDPLVNRYLEEELNEKKSGTNNSSRTMTYGRKDTTTHGHVIATEHGETITTAHGEKITTEHGEQVTTTHGEQITRTHGEKITQSGTDSRLTKNNQTQNQKTTATIAERSTETNGATAGISQSDSRALAASLPRVDSYTANGIPAPDTVKTSLGENGTLGAQTAAGMVAAPLDWRNADSQSETVGAASNAGNSHGSTSSKVNGDDVTNVDTSYSGEADKEDTNYGRVDTHSGDDIDKHAGDDIDKHSGSDVDTHSGNDVDTHSGTDTQTNSGDDITQADGSDVDATAGGDSSQGNTRRRYTGREGSAGELLTQAAHFVKNTGAFVWLCGKIAECFYGVICEL